MTDFSQILKKKFKPDFKVIKSDIEARKDKEYFSLSGTQIFCGRQGSGKTISAVNSLREIKKVFPKAIIVSNLDLTNYHALTFNDKEWLKVRQTTAKKHPNECYIRFNNIDELSMVLTMINNGKYGVIYLIDEIHTYFNSLDSKNIPIHIFTEISQQRKQRKLIIGTSQLFLRMAKPLREQCDNLVMCSTFFGIFTITKAYDAMTLEQDYDGSLSGDVKKRGWFFHDRKLRNSFDTFQKVVSSEIQFEENQVKIDKKLSRKLGF